MPPEIDAQAFEQLMEQHTHEWSAILVKRSASSLKVFLWRSLTSSFDVFYFLDESALYLSDSFAGCAAHVPKQVRYPSDDAIVDHFLFRTPIGELTYFENVHRVGHGMRVTVDLCSRTTSKKQFTTYFPRSQSQSIEQCLEVLDAALQATLSEYQSDDDAVMFSGGVDSTLLSSYLPNNPLVTSRIASQEFEKEFAYAEGAAKLLGKQMCIYTLSEEDFLNRFEETTDQLWMPPHHQVSIVLAEVFKAKYKNFIVAEFADGLFGLFPYKDYYHGQILANPLIQLLLAPLAPLPFRQPRRLLSLGQSFRIPPTRPGSFASRFGNRGTLKMAEQLFSHQEVYRRLTSRYEYVANFMKFERTSGEMHAHLEIGHSMGYFCENILCVWRQLASSHGKTVYTPFANRLMFDSAMSIPAAQRSVDNHTVKYLLKKLLKRRVPNYPIDLPKFGGALPIGRFLAHGPLQRLFDRYPPPEFISHGTLKNMINKNMVTILWNTILYSVWKGRIAEIDSTPTPALKTCISSPSPDSVSKT
jgi:asparagine synthetase B (glutamine-hydrolysing)